MVSTSSRLSSHTSPSNSTRRSAGRQKLWRFLGMYSFVIPALVFLAIFTIYPIVTTAVFSFETVNLGGLIRGSTPFAGLQNYQEVFADPAFGQIVVVSLIFTLGSVAFQYCIGFALALLFTQRFPLTHLFRGLVMLGYILPTVVTATIFKWILQEKGVFNLLLLHFHLISKSILWLADPHYALSGVILTNIWLGIPFHMSLLMAGLQGISPTLYEASRVDGASIWQRFWAITLPLMRSPSLVVLTIGVIHTLNVFDLIYILTGGGPVNATMVIPIYSFQEFFQLYNLGTGAAITMIMFVFLLIFASGYLYMIRREEVL